MHFFLSPTLTFLQPLPCRFRVPLRRWEQVIAPEGADRCGVLVRVGEADVAGGCGTCRALVRHSRAQGGLARRRDTNIGTGGGRLGRPPFTPWLGVNTYVYVVIGGAKLPASCTLLTERLKYMPRLVKVQSFKDANIREI